MYNSSAVARVVSRRVIMRFETAETMWQLLKEERGGAGTQGSPFELFEGPFRLQETLELARLLYHNCVTTETTSKRPTMPRHPLRQQFRW